MAMFRESRHPHSCILDPDDVEKYLAINAFPGQRKLKWLTVAEYCRAMKEGRQRRIPIATVYVEENGAYYLMNGQHNLHALLQYGKPYPAVIYYYVTPTMEGAWRLFATFDNHWGRTKAHVLGAAQKIMTNKDLRDLPKKVLASCSTALVALDKGGNGTPKFNRQRVADHTIHGDAIMDNPEDVLFVGKYWDAKHLRAVGTVTAIIVTRRKDERDASNFWAAVADGELLEKSNPEYKLRKALLEKRYLSVLRGSGATRHESEYNIAILWWNARRSGIEKKYAKLGSIKGLLKAV